MIGQFSGSATDHTSHDAAPLTYTYDTESITDVHAYQVHGENHSCVYVQATAVSYLHIACKEYSLETVKCLCENGGKELLLEQKMTLIGLYANVVVGYEEHMVHYCQNIS